MALEISIHAPVRGATKKIVRERDEAIHFNPRARAGRDLEKAERNAAYLDFNPRARAGRDCY